MEGKLEDEGRMSVRWETEGLQTVGIVCLVIMFLKLMHLLGLIDITETGERQPGLNYCLIFFHCTWMMALALKVHIFTIKQKIDGVYFKYGQVNIFSHIYIISLCPMSLVISMHD